MKIHGDLDFTNTGSLVQTAIGVEAGDDFPPDEDVVIGRLAFFNKKLWIAADIVLDVPVWVALTNEINSFIFDQSSPSDTWTIEHNLDTETPVVQVYDATGTMIIPDAVTPDDENNLTITYGSAIAGTAVIVAGNGIGAISGGGGSGTVTSVAATQPAAGLTISGSPITTSGTLTFALADDLAAVEGLSSTGLVTRTAANTWSVRSIVGTSNRISVTNGDGISGSPTLDIDSAYVGQNTITTLGTITTGVWAGTTIPLNKGGTGQTTANTSFNALAPSQSGNSGKYLTTNGTDTSWSTVTQSGTFTATLTGVTGSTTGTARYAIAGNVCTIALPFLTGVSNTTACTITGLPSQCIPSFNFRFYFQPIMNNGALSTTIAGARECYIIVMTSGVITLAWEGAASGFTASGIKGLNIGNNVTFTYPLNV